MATTLLSPVKSLLRWTLPKFLLGPTNTTKPAVAVKTNAFESLRESSRRGRELCGTTLDNYTVDVPLQKNQQLIGKSLQIYTISEPLYTRPGDSYPSIWTASTGTGQQVIVKQPCRGWLDPFLIELRHLHDFQSSQHLRRLFDIIDRSPSEPPAMVLESMSRSLLEVYWQRKLTTREIKTIAKGVLHGLDELHSKGLAHTDINMQNILVDGFGDTAESSSLKVKLADLGSVSPPSDHMCQREAFRAPEVWFLKPWQVDIDIWSFGMLCRPDNSGTLKKSDSGGTISKEEVGIENTERCKWETYHLFELGKLEYYKDCKPPDIPSLDGQTKVTMGLRTMKMGLSPVDWGFLNLVVLRPLPEERPTPRMLLEKFSWWFEKLPAEDESGNVI
ncbi:MAG: hypothetical protein M1827_000671 [Pycnora praestabilis]|nr:MAG: hypothetical protein M1827_000671 [Pycnora praestabilis]